MKSIGTCVAKGRDSKQADTWPFDLGTAVGVIPCGKGKLLVSTLNIVGLLPGQDGPSSVARKLLCNYLEYAQKH